MRFGIPRAHHHSPARSALAVAFVCLVHVGGCAWNYAGEEGRTRDERPVEQEPQVVRVEDAPAAVVPEVEAQSALKTPATETDAAASACGRSSFIIHYFDAATQETREVNCETRAVTPMNRTPMGGVAYQEARAANLPAGSWYFFVDPKGLDPGHLNNRNLLKLSRHFDIEYLGRDPRSELLIYLYLGAVD